MPNNEELRNYYMLQGRVCAMRDFIYGERYVSVEDIEKIMGWAYPELQLIEFPPEEAEHADAED